MGRGGRRLALVRSKRCIYGWKGGSVALLAAPVHSFSNYLHSLTISMDDEQGHGESDT